MKIRNDFVTNSSSSSYIISMKDDNKELKQFIDKNSSNDLYSICYKITSKAEFFKYLIDKEIISSWTFDRIVENLKEVDLNIPLETICLVLFADKYDFKKYYEALKLVESGKTLYGIHLNYDFISYHPELRDEIYSSEFFIENED